MPTKPKRVRATAEATSEGAPVIEDSPAETAPEVALARAPQTKLPDRTPKLTAARALAGRRGNPLVQAFLHQDGLEHRTRRLTRAEWAAEYKTFLAAPRP